MKLSSIISEVLENGQKYLKSAGIITSRLDAELLLAYCLKKDRTKLYVDWQCNIKAEEMLLFSLLLARRAKREPLAYIVGYKEFWSMNIRVDRHVLIPRPETEILVQEAVALLHQTSQPGRRQKILDVGTGSGAVALALAREAHSSFVIASDVSFEALKIARANADTFGLNDTVIFACVDVLSAFRHNGFFDLVVSNPPYIATQDIELLDPEIRNFEPRQAIDGGKDGLDYYKALIPLLTSILKDGGWVVLEIGAGQAAAVMELFESCSRYRNIRVVKDYGQHERVIRAQRF